jgi:hypothetical protein
MKLEPPILPKARRTAFGPLLPFASGCSLATSSRRGRRYPPGAHAGAVGAWRHRLHCDARSGLAPHNSLRSLRSLRSDRCGESVHQARWRAPSPALRFSSPQKSPLPGTACREVHRLWRSSIGTPRCWQQRRVRAGRSAHGRRREAQGSWPRAYPRASCSDLSHLSERRERSERSELCDRPRDRCTEPGHKQSGGLFVPGEGPGHWPGPQGSRCRQAATAEDKRCGLPGRAFARADVRKQSGLPSSPLGRTPTPIASWDASYVAGRARRGGATEMAR